MQTTEASYLSIKTPLLDDLKYYEFVLGSENNHDTLNQVFRQIVEG